ncbi:MAG: hypothetical protein IPN95_12495 [Bacteroidetes bacterium]|nr:hypothetical protein [Bacteroidota bacterium]
MNEQNAKRWLLMLALIGLLTWPAVVSAQNWTREIELKDRQANGAQPTVAKVTFAAYTMDAPTSPGKPIAAGTDAIMFQPMEAGFIKFKIIKIDWSPLGTTFDGSADFKIIVRNLWVDMSPQIYLEGKKGGNPAAMRKRYITAQNFEYVKGDSLPPPQIFKVDKNGSYAFTVGVKAVTPKTTEEKPFDFVFNFKVEGLLKSIDVPVVVDVPEPPIETTKVAPPKQTEFPDIDAAVKIAKENEDAEALIDLIQDNPEVPSCREARAYLAIKMTKELIDSVTYRVDISYAKFTRALPNRDQINLSFSRFGSPISETAVNAQWRDGKLYVRPPKDSLDYVVGATHKVAPENKASITLNSVKDNIKFAYRDTMEGARVEIKVKGGKAPYTVFLQRLTEGVFFEVEGSMAISGDTVIDKEKIARIFKLAEEGDYRLSLVDAEQLKKTGSGTVHIVPPPPIPPIVWYIALGLLVAFFIGFLLYRREQRRKDEELEKLLESRGGSDPRVKRKPKPELQRFWKETAISELSLHKNFIREVATYLKERPHFKSDKPLVEGVLLGTVLKFDFENEQYEVRLDRFRAIAPHPVDFYEDAGDVEKWPEIKEVAADHRDLVKIGWLQVVEGRPMRLSQIEQEFQDEQFSELFQLLLKIDFVDGKKLCGFFTRTTSGKINDVNDRLDGIDYWLNWDELEDAGYYEAGSKPVRDESGAGKIKVKIKGQETA